MRPLDPSAKLSSIPSSSRLATLIILSMDLKATAYSRFLVKRLNFQTRIISNGALGLLPSSIISLNWGLSATRLLSASSTYSRATE